MTAMARAGGGNAYYGQTAEDLLEPFQEELALMNAVCARRVRLRLEPTPGVEAAVLNAYAQDSEGWALPDLVAGGEAWAMVRLVVPVRSFRSCSGDAAPLLHASLRYVDLAGEPRAVQPVALSVPALPSAAYAAVAEDPLVARRATELAAAELQRKAREAVRRRDWAGVDALLAELEALARDHEWLAGILAELRQLAARRDEALFAREAHYAASRLSTRVAACYEPSALDRDTTDMPAFLQRKRAQGKRGTAGPEKG